MTKIILKTAGSEHILFSGEFNTLKGCVESAVSQGVCLDNVDLRGANLMNAELDGGTFRHARFDGANLTGANLSDADLQWANFHDGSLYNACLCESRLMGAQFFGATFGATDIAWVDISQASFDTLSALELNFSECLMMKGALFYDRTGAVCAMSRPPVVVRGLKQSVVLFDDFMKIGAAVLPYAVWEKLLKTGELKGFGGEAAIFMQHYGQILSNLAVARGEGGINDFGQKQKNVA